MIPFPRLKRPVKFTDPVLSYDPIPRNAVAYHGGTAGDDPVFFLTRNGVDLFIEAPYKLDYSQFDPNDEYYGWRITVKYQQIHGHFLEIIQSLLDEAHFSESKWAYLLHDTQRGYYLRHRERILPKVTCPLWAPIILESEILFTTWGLLFERRGIWKGLDVDVYYAWDEKTIINLDYAMRGYKALADLDITFELYGHLLRNDGTVIGLVMEAGRGRMINSSDRSLIYKTVSTIQASGCLYRGCLTNRFMISPEGKVRLLEMSSVEKFPKNKRHQLDKLAELWHWKELNQLFEEFKTHGPWGNFREPPDRFTVNPTALKLAVPPPGPERPLGGLYCSWNIFRACYISYWEGYELIATQKSRRRKEMRQSAIASVGVPGKDAHPVLEYDAKDRLGRSRRKPFIASTDCSVHDFGPTSEYDMEDRPLILIDNALSRIQRGAGPVRASSYPYRPTNMKYISRVSDCTEPTTSSYLEEVE